MEIRVSRSLRREDGNALDWEWGKGQYENCMILWTREREAEGPNAKCYSSPSLLEMSNDKFTWFVRAIEKLSKEVSHSAEPEPKVFDSSGLTLAVYETDEDGNAKSVTDVPPSGSYPETTERQDPQRWCWDGEDANSNSVL